MQRKNIPNYVLAKGISREGFEQLLQDIRNAVMEEGVNEFSNYSELLNFIKEKDGSNAEQWISDFEMQLTESVTVINENMAKIESLFARIFADWEVYKQEHNIVEEEKEEPVTEESATTAEETPVVLEKEEVVQEEVKVELEPVILEPATTEEPKTEESSEKQEEVTVPTVEESPVEETKEEEKPKKEKKSKKDKSEVTEGDNNG